MRAKTLLHAPLLLLSLGLLACGGSIGPAQTPTTIVIKEDAAGKTVSAHIGDTIEIQLEESFPFPGSSLTWDVTSSAPSVLKPDKVTRDPADRPRQGTVKYTADFLASGSGQGKLFARGSQTCEAMPTCPQKDFIVTVDVS